MKTFSVEFEGEWIPAEDFHRLACEACVDPEGVEIVIKGLDHLDCSALQILLSLRKQMLADGHMFQLRSISPALKRAFQLAGAEEFCEAGEL